MFDFLSYFGNRVVGRYKTVESNIKNRSNSFYDSYLDLLEDTIKTELMNEEVGYDGRTCGEILREPDINNFYKHRIKVSVEVYSKVCDYIRKINEHKHHNEKYVNVETVVNYMNVYYLFVQPYLNYKQVEISLFNEPYFRSIYGVTLERSKDLENVTQKVDDYVSSTNTKLDEHEIRLNSLEALSREFSARKMNPQSQSTQQSKTTTTNKSDKDVMQWFFRNSRKSWRWFGNQRELNKAKNLTIFSHVLLLFLGILSTILTSSSTKTYSTFTFFENIWLIFGILLLVYAVKAQLKYESEELAIYNSYKFKEDQYGLWNPGPEKKAFKVFRWIAIISTICNIVFIRIKASETSWIATIFEILFLGAIIFSFVMNASLFAQYNIIYLEGKNMSGTEFITLVWDPMIKKFMTEEDYKKKIPFLFNKY